MPTPSSLLVIVVTLCLLGSPLVAPFKLPRNMTLPAVFAFGDSIIDPGNNNGLLTVAKSNFHPYGRDFYGRVATGRFSNGRVPSDFLAEAIGVKDTLPAYLDPSLDTCDLLTGVSFASGAAGYDPLSAQLALVFSMSDQLNLFREYIGKIRAEVGDERTRTIISESLYVVCTGSNDITNTYFSIPVRSFVYDIPSYAGFIAELASEFLQELYGIGARRIGVLSLPPAGCLPSQRTIKGGTDRDCFEPANRLASLANSKIQSKIRSLGSNLLDAKIVFLDIYYPLMNIIQHPAPYGFTYADVGCCGTGKIEVSVLCNNFDDPSTCKDAKEYVFWDSYHPTEATYRLLVSHLLDKYAHEFY
ncbi:hypothetical protein MLD38_004724 [Melastoma candidum]|uniref:Uncharacterized protein n=1 Tax=Melastoma candidum TaxID=119954 RepID=A0ACB9S7E9_9MYRT|nr:hypothetical protein MLD38_004724 [Melastoma candidum]